MKRRKFKYYEVYCERVPQEWVSESDNFSLCLKVPSGQGKPTIKRVTEILGEALVLDGDHYCVLGLWAEDDGGWDHRDFDKKDIYTYSRA